MILETINSPADVKCLSEEQTATLCRELRSFKLLIGVSGVGPRAALSILSAVTPQQLALAVVTEDEKALTAANGIGKKIAQRVICLLYTSDAADD